MEEGRLSTASSAWTIVGDGVSPKTNSTETASTVALNATSKLTVDPAAAAVDDDAFNSDPFNPSVPQSVQNVNETNTTTTLQQEATNAEEAKRCPSQQNHLFGWLSSAAKAVSASGQQFIQTVRPEFEEFAQTIAADTSQFLKSKLRADAEPAADNSAPQGNGTIDGPEANHSDDSRHHQDWSTTADQTSPKDSMELGSDTLPTSLQKTTTHFQASYFKTRSDPNTYIIPLQDPTTSPDPELGDVAATPTDSSVAQDVQKVELVHRFLSMEVKDLMELKTDYIASDAVVNHFYDRFVPHSVSDSDFWRRFLCRVEILKMTDAQLSKILTDGQTSPNDIEDDCVDWGS